MKKAAFSGRLLIHKYVSTVLVAATARLWLRVMRLMSSFATAAALLERKSGSPMAKNTGIALVTTKEDCAAAENRLAA